VTAEAGQGMSLTSRATEAVSWLRAARIELDKVTWPTRDELIKATRMIVLLSIALGAVIGLMDLLLNAVLVTWLAALTR
jgi:preprotein translocase subunit SecE